MALESIKRIADLGGRELRYTLLKEEKKFDIRKWNGDKYEDGVRFSEDELKEFYRLIVTKASGKVGNKDLSLDNNEYILSILNNGRLYKRTVVTVDEANKLVEIIDSVIKSEGSFTEQLLNYEPPKATAKKVGRPKKTDVTSVAEKNVDDKKIVYLNGYDKFAAQFEEFRNNQPEQMRKGFEMMHNIVLEHIKDICSSSDEYNNASLQEWKNSHKLMAYLQTKAFENPELMFNFEEAKTAIYGWVDEYMGLDDKPTPPPKKTTTTTKKKTTKKKAS